MPRLFIGTYLEKEAQDSCGALPLLNNHLTRSWHTRLKWVRQDKLHLTWIFLGDVESNQMPQLSQTLQTMINASRGDSLNLPPQALAYDCLEIWYSHGTPRNIVLTPNEASADILDFVQSVRNQLHMFASDDVREQAVVPWKPHITLIRLPDANKTTQLPLADEITHWHKHRNLKGKELVPTALTGLSELLPLNHLLKTVSLIESKEENGTHNYKTVQSFSLI